jgi:4-amino-4-deoxychorismate lyase
VIHYYKGRFSEAGIMLDPTEPAFRFGVGFFETLYYNGKDVCHIDLHLDRLLHSLRVYGIDYGTVDFSAVMVEVLKRNGLQGTTARLNIFYPMESPKAQPAIMAVPYEPKPYKGYRLCLCDDRHISTLNEQKTTSYMFYHLAFRKALARGFDDAALFGFVDNLLE